MPVLICSEIYPFVCLLTCENEVVAYDVTRDDFVLIPFVVHGCESIDYVGTLNAGSQTNSNIFFFWSVKSKSVTMYDWNPESTCKIQKLHWTNPAETFVHRYDISYRSSTFTFLPAVQGDSNSSAENIRYVFAVHIG